MHSENSKHKRRRLRHVLFCDRWPDERVGIKVRNWIYQYNSGQIHKKYFLHATNGKKTSDKALEWTTPGTNYKKENGKRGMQSLGCGK